MTLTIKLKSKFFYLAHSLAVSGIVAHSGYADEAALKPLKELDGAAKNKDKSSYVSIKGGSTSGQSAELTVGELPFDLDEYNGAFVFGIDVGYEWKLKRFPIQLGLEFEGGFMSSELNGTLNPEVPTVAPPPPLDPTATPAPYAAPDSPGSFTTDMNAAFFLINGTVTFDPWRYRARLGPYITRVRPYLGGGIGGAQIWFRNTEVTALDPTMTPTGDPFNTDQFVFAYQWFGGVNIRVNDKISVFGEYRNLVFEDFDGVTGLEIDGWLTGLRINY